MISGEEIYRNVKARGMSVRAFARALPTTRENACRIFKKSRTATSSKTSRKTEKPSRYNLSLQAFLVIIYYADYLNLS